MSSEPKSKSKPKYDFLTCVEKSKVIEPERLQEWLGERDRSNSKELAAKMVRDGLLTKWQAKYLFSGRYRLWLGNYMLLKRIRRDEFGDRFVAVHPQLGRDVHVQVLPVELTNHDAQRTAFLKKASMASELDHPNLSHVIDIDREQGRYYLITEVVSGQPLAEISPASLDNLKLGRILDDALSALSHAHKKDVVHGNLSADNLLIDDGGKLKITQIALSPLAVPGSNDNWPSASPDNAMNDLHDVVTLVGGVAQHIPKFESTPASEEFAAILSALATTNQSKFDLAREQLGQWLEDQEAAGSVVGTAIVSPVASEADDSPADSTKREATNSARPATRDAQTTQESTAEETAQHVPSETADPSGDDVATKETISSIPFLWKAVGVGLACIAVGAYVLNQFPKATDSQTESPKTTKRIDADRDFGTQQVTPRTRFGASEDGSASTKVSGETKLDPSSLKEKLDNLVSDNPDKPKSKPTASKPVSLVPKSPQKSSTVAVPKEKPEPNKTVVEPTTESNAAAKESATTQEPAKPATNPKSEAKSKPKRKKKPPAKPAPEIKPFAKLPESVDLPDSESSQEVMLAAFELPKNMLLGLELVTGADVSRQKTIFEIERTPTDKQKWHVLFKRRPNEDSFSIAQLRRSQKGLHFQWTDAGNGTKLANYLRNCRLTLKTNSDLTWLTLRQPIALPEFSLKADKLSVRIDSAIDWLPNPEALVVELLPWQKPLPKVILEPAIVESGQPAAIHFQKTGHNQFLWIEVNSDVKTKLKLQADLLLKGPNGRGSPVKHGKSLPDIAAKLEQVAQGLEQEYEQKNAFFSEKKDTDIFKGKITDTRDYLKKLKSSGSVARSQAGAAAANVKLIPRAFDQPIPLRIWYKLDDHKIMLADTTGGKADSEKK